MDLISALFTGDLFDTVQWRESLWLWAMLLPVAVWWLKRFGVKKSKAQYADAHLWPWVEVSSPSGSSSWKGRLANLLSPAVLVSVAWLAMVIALAGPRVPVSSQTQADRPGVDLLVLMDLSRSMTAEDVFPNRFQQASALVESMTHRLQPNDRLALMGFAGQPHLVSPLSFDRELFSFALQRIEPGLLPTRGSWIELAAMSGVHHLQQTGGDAKVMVVFTNGAPPFWTPPELPQAVQSWPESRDLREQSTGVKIVWVGIGQPSGTTLQDPQHRTGKLHANGVLVQSPLNENELKKWAQTTQGVYLRADSGAAFMQRLMDEVTLPAQQRPELQNERVWQDWAQPFMVLSVLALIAAFYPLTFTARVGQESSGTDLKNWAGLFIFLPILGMVLSLSSMPVFAAASELAASKQQAYQAYQAKVFDQAQALYAHGDDYESLFGAGAAAYQEQDLESAVLYFREAAWAAKQDADRARALFNLGNSYYQANLLPQAIESYRQALQYQTPYAKAENNLQLALQRQLQIKLAQKSKDAKGDEEGQKGREDSDGAFYGGQKPTGGEDNPGFGSDSDMGGLDKETVILPQQGELTDYRLQGEQGSETWQSGVDVSAQQATAQAILDQQKKIARAQRFEQQIHQLKDEQKVLLQRMFEREEGFQAQQKEPHPIPGVQPW